MSIRLRRARAIAIAVVALAVSATIVLAGPPPGKAEKGLEKAADHSGKSHPRTGPQGTEQGKNEAADTSETETETEEDGGENCATDPRGLSTSELEAMTHGSIVCWAAHQETPAGYANHGAFVSEWAHWGKAAAGATKSQRAFGHSHKAKGTSITP